MQSQLKLRGPYAPGSGKFCRVRGVFRCFPFTLISVLASLPLAAANAQTYRIKAGVSQGYQNMRSGPGQGHSIVARVPAGTDGIQSTGKCRDPDEHRSKFRWCEYRWQGLVGWMSSNGLEDVSLTPSTPESRPQNAPEGKTFGTGVLISKDGKVLTNSHVVRDCGRVDVKTVGSTPSVGNVLAIDEAIDLALLKTDAVVTTLPPFRTDARLGESVFAFGFPLAGLLASSGNFTSGNITANAGIEDDITRMQISAPVQPGNSGGPLLDQFGNIVGVVVAKLDALKYAEVTKDVPQNVNFAIKSSIAVDFLKAHGLMVAAVADAEPLAPAEIAVRAIAVTVQVVCK